MKTVRQRVAAGVSLLDELGPPGWREKIRPNSLDMVHNCVLDQIFGDWDRGLEILNLKGRGPEDYGFCPIYSEPDDRDRLGSAWITEVCDAPA
jgi:hypothetical protein